MGCEQRLECTVADLILSEGGSVKTGPFGTVLKADEYVSVGVPLVSVREIVRGGFHVDSKTPRISEETTRRLPEYVLQRNDIVFARKGSVERCAIVGERESGWFLGSDGIRLRPPASVDARYLAYTFQSKAASDWLIQQATGSTMASLNQAILLRFPLSLPPLREQLAISSVLGALDDRIDLLRQTNTTLEAIAQALFKSWFVDFDPVHAKAEGRDPEAMDAATATLFPSEFEQSELGLIPKGWRAGTLDDLSHLNAMSWSSKRHPDAVIYVDLSGVHENRIGTVKELPYSGAPSRARRSLRDGDTIVGTVRPGNRAFAYIHCPAANLTGSTGFAVLTPKDEASTPFVYLAATQDDSIERLANLADGGAYPAVRPNVVSATPVVIPPASIITAFSRITTPMLHKIGESRDAEATLVELRDTLLPRLISGRLRLPEAMETAKEARE